jgi:hypothetical protein
MLKAYVTQPRAWFGAQECGISAAGTRDEAKYGTFLALSEFDYDVSGPHEVCAWRVPELDDWANGHEHRLASGGYAPEAVPGGVDAARRVLASVAARRATRQDTRSGGGVVMDGSRESTSESRRRPFRVEGRYAMRLDTHWASHGTYATSERAIERRDYLSRTYARVGWEFRIVERES